MRKQFLTPLLLFLFAAPAALAAIPGPPIQNIRDSAAIEVRAEDHDLDRRIEARARKPRPKAPQAATPPHLQAIAACESGGDPRAVSSNGMYRGKYQFSTATWQAVGGSGDPAAAPEAEQDKRAAALYQQSGPGQWPVCGS